MSNSTKLLAIQLTGFCLWRKEGYDVIKNLILVYITCFSQKLDNKSQ